MVAFAMRKWVKQIFALDGKPREARQIVDDVVEMFKAWEEGKKSNKLNFMFESKESTSLCKSLIGIFKLNTLPGYKDVSSLTDARWAVLEYAKQKGFPLWALKYSHCSDDMASLIGNIVKICDPNGLSNQELIGETSKLIRKLELDLTLLLVEPDVFKKGFLEFLKQDPMAKVQDNEFDDLYNYLLSHLQSEIGRWSEDEVQRQELYWRMSQQEPEPKPTPDPVPNPYPTPTPNPNPVKEPITKEELAERRKLVSAKVAKASNEHVRLALIEMIDNVDEHVLDMIMKYVQ